MSTGLLRELAANETRKVKERARELKEKTKHVHIGHLFANYGADSVGRPLGKDLSSLPEEKFEKFHCSFYPPMETHRTMELTYKVPPLERAELLLRCLSERRDPNVYLADVVTHLEDAEMWHIINRLYENKALEDLCKHKAVWEGNCVHSKPLPWILQSDWVEPSLPKASLNAGTPTGVLKGRILLTFVDDGASTAHELKQLLQQPYGRQHRYYIVRTVKDVSPWILQDEVEHLRLLIDWADFVVPICTPGYNKMLVAQKKEQHSEFLDSKYAPLIYNMLHSEWIFNGLKNKKIRCYSPQWTDRPKKPPLAPFNTSASDISSLRKNLKKVREVCE